MARAHGCTTSQLALAWLLAKNPDVVPIPGTTSAEHLADNVAAAQLVLGEQDVRELDRLVPIGAGAGQRYPAASMSSVDA